MKSFVILKYIPIWLRFIRCIGKYIKGYLARFDLRPVSRYYRCLVVGYK